MLAACAVVLLWLMPVSYSTLLTCEELVRPLNDLDPRHLEGRWALLAGSFSDPAHLKFFKLRDSSSIHFSNTNVTSNVSYTPSVYYGGECHHKTYSVSLDGSTLNFDEREQVNLTLTFLFTSCSDCLVMRFDNESKKIERLLLFSKRRAAEPEELEEYRVQARCLNLLPPAVMDPTKKLCQDQSAQTEREQQA